MAELELRGLRGDDLFSILGIFDKLDIADKLPGLVAEFTGGDEPKRPAVARTSTAKAVKAEWAEYDAAMDKYTSARGISIMGTVAKLLLGNLGKVRVELNSLLADLTETSVEDIQALSLAAYIRLVSSLVKHPDFREVFRSAVSSVTAEDTAS